MISEHLGRDHPPFCGFDTHMLINAETVSSTIITLAEMYVYYGQTQQGQSKGKSEFQSVLRCH